jgi:hypothetical protein
MNDPSMEANVTGLIKEGLSFKLNTFQLVFHPIIICTSVPLNLFVGYVLLSDKQLRNVRNSIWFGIVASNLTNLFMASLRQFLFYNKSYVACQLFTVLFSKPYIVLLITSSAVESSGQVRVEYSGGRVNNSRYKSLNLRKII